MKAYLLFASMFVECGASGHISSSMEEGEVQG